MNNKNVKNTISVKEVKEVKKKCIEIKFNNSNKLNYTIKNMKIITLSEILVIKKKKWKGNLDI